MMGHSSRRVRGWYIAWLSSICLKNGVTLQWKLIQSIKTVKTQNTSQVDDGHGWLHQLSSHFVNYRYRLIHARIRKFLTATSWCTGDGSSPQHTPNIKARAWATQWLSFGSRCCPHTRWMVSILSMVAICNTQFGSVWKGPMNWLSWGSKKKHVGFPVLALWMIGARSINITPTCQALFTTCSTMNIYKLGAEQLKVRAFNRCANWASRILWSISMDPTTGDARTSSVA